MTPAESPALSRNAWAEGFVRATIPHVRSLLRAGDAQDAAIGEAHRRLHAQEGDEEGTGASDSDEGTSE